MICQMNNESLSKVVFQIGYQCQPISDQLRLLGRRKKSSSSLQLRSEKKYISCCSLLPLVIWKLWPEMFWARVLQLYYNPFVVLQLTFGLWGVSWLNYLQDKCCFQEATVCNVLYYGNTSASDLWTLYLVLPRQRPPHTNPSDLWHSRRWVHEEDRVWFSKSDALFSLYAHIIL